jgi:hypothetical protein
MFAIIEELYNKVTVINNTRQISSIRVEALINSVYNTYHDRSYFISFFRNS